MSPTSFVNLVLLLVLFGVCRALGEDPAAFRNGAWGLLVLCYLGSSLIFIWSYPGHVAEIEQLWAEYPGISVAERLAYESDSPVVLASGSTRSNLPRPVGGEPGTVRLELELEGYGHDWRRSGLESLHDMHRSFVTEFVSAPGFGFIRGQRLHLYRTARSGRLKLPAAEPIPLPPPSAESSSVLPQQATEPPEAPSAGDLAALHRGGILDFSHPATFGYVRDRYFVAGFQPHQFRQKPKLPKPANGDDVHWEIADLALVSLLKHAPPAVYVSPNLPRMEDLQDVPTRSLTQFEDVAIAKLQTGEELIVDAQAEQIHMVGAIRAAKQCLQCHQVQRGSLLGAFTYRLLPNPPRPQPPPPAPRVTDYRSRRTGEHRNGDRS